jgi:hypothetical protein
MANPVKELKASTTATRVSFKWLGLTCKMEDTQKEEMAATVEAEADSISVSKRLYNNKLACIKKAQKVKGKIKEYWERVTLPYVDPGVRLLKRASLTEFNEQMTKLQEELSEAAQEVQAAREEILNDARKRLQKAFNEANYPQDLSTLFGVEWSFPSIEPPNYLAQMAPHVYEQEKQRAAAKLEEAIALAEQAFLQEFKGIVSHLHECLAPTADGKRKIFRDSAVNNFQEFFQRFKALSVGSSQELEGLVSQATELMQGVKADELRKGNLLRNEVSQGLADIKQKLAPLVVDKPRRNIIKPLPKKEEPAQCA